LDVLNADRRSIYKVNYDKNHHLKFGAWLKHVSGQGAVYLREVSE
jgi:hypothetical protein